MTSTARALRADATRQVIREHPTWAADRIAGLVGVSAGTVRKMRVGLAERERAILAFLVAERVAA